MLLVPFVVHAAWDYLESWSLARNIAAIRANHEPVSSHEIDPFRLLKGEEAEAERLYRARRGDGLQRRAKTARRDRLGRSDSRAVI